MERGIVDLINLYRHDSFKLFDSALNLCCLRRFVSEPFYKVLDVCNFLLLVFVGTELLLSSLSTQFDIFIIFHLIVGDSAAGNFQCAVGDVVDECAVVADQYHCAAAAG